MKLNPDSPAFPTGSSMDKGLTIRAEFAKSAMMGLMANVPFTDRTCKEIADWSVEQADALIARLNEDEK